MKKIEIDLKKIDKKIIDLIADYLNMEKVIAYPTDTIYGLGSRADSKRAIKKIFKIKQRKSDQPLLMLVGSIGMAKKYCRINKAQEEYIKKKWPGPFTFILESRGVLPEELSGETASLAVRLPKNDFILKIIKKIKVPLISTSLNISGKESLIDLENVEDYFETKPDLVLDAGQIKGKPSTLIDLRDMENVKVLRR